MTPVPRSATAATTLSILRGGVELFALDPAQLEQAQQCFFDQVVRARRAGRDPDDDWSLRQPKMRNYFAFLVQIVMLDFGGRDEPRSIEHEISGQLLFAHLGEMRSV